MIVAAYRIKNESRWIAESLMRSLAVADRAVVFDDHSEDDTREIVANFPNVEVVPSPYEGFNEARDRGHLFRRCIEIGAHWVLALDGDEVLTPSAIREIREFSSGRGILALRIAYLWDTTDRERCDGIFDTFMQQVFWSVFDQPDLRRGVVFKKGTSNGRHCGRCPKNHRGTTVYGKNSVKHYSYLFEEDRRRKHLAKTKNDPVGARRQWYDHIIERPTRFAPGPPQFRPYADL